MKRFAVIPLIAIASMNADAVSNNVKSCIIKNQNLIKDNEDASYGEIEEIEKILAGCPNIDIREVDNEEILEYLRHTGWTWQ